MRKNGEPKWYFVTFCGVISSPSLVTTDQLCQEKSTEQCNPTSVRRKRHHWAETLRKSGLLQIQSRHAQRAGARHPQRVW
jgi:hypothetical protein